MKRTPEHYKREHIRKLFDRVLKEGKISLSPVSISVDESFENDFTETNFSFRRLSPDPVLVSITSSRGKGFVDGLFNGLYEHFRKDYFSVEKIKLVDIMVNPMMRYSPSGRGTDAEASVAFRIEVGGHGTAEFLHRSRSLIHSSFCAALEAFQFYANCEESFNRIQLALQDAKSRNRSDIMDKCRFDLSKLTEVNNYERKRGN